MFSVSTDLKIRVLVAKPGLDGHDRGAQVIGLSILSGAHNAIVPRVMDLLKQNKMDDVLVLVGGIIPDQDIEGLRKIGVAGIFQPGTPMNDIVKFIREHVKPHGVPAV